MKKTLLSIVAFCLLMSCALSAAEPRRLNVLFFFADDQRADTISAWGNPIIKTPSIDRIAARGMSFHRAYMQGSMNPATCVPSRAMLMSGRSLFHVDEKLLDCQTWPAAFRNVGYTTRISGKWHNGVPSLASSFSEGRDIFLGGMGDPTHIAVNDLVNGKIVNKHTVAKHACEVFADDVIEFLKKPSQGPFFYYLPFDAPHDPHIVPADFAVKYDADRIPLPACFMPQHPWDNGEMSVRDELLLPWPREPAAVKQMIADYYRYISYMDGQIGRVLDALDASPHAKDTIVIFSADSGVARGSHGLIGKQNLYELDSVRVPLIVAGPGIAPGTSTDAMCYLYDLLPTIGKLCNVSAPATSEGLDLGPTLADPKHAGRERLIFAYKKCQRAICDRQWKLIRYPQVDRTQLFDLSCDPEEAHDLSTRPDHAAKAAELMAQMQADLKQAGDTVPLTAARLDSAEWTPPKNP